MGHRPDSLQGSNRVGEVLGQSINDKLSRLRNLTVIDRIKSQREVIGLLASALKDEQLRRFECERLFQSKIQGDAQLIVDLVKCLVILGTETWL